jgi:hypothetical protein
MTANRSAYRWLVVVAVLALGGCGRPYVNIPALEGSVASSNPNSITARQVETAALQAVIADQNYQQPVQIILPPQTSTLTSVQIVPQVGELAIWVDAQEQAATPLSLTVNAVRVRSMSGQVDITAADSASQHSRLLTAHLKWAPFSGWYVHRLHNWGVIDDASLSDQPTPAQSP